MDINFEYYKIFYLVAKSKSFTKAADKPFVSQPAVTQNIKKLEDLGVLNHLQEENHLSLF